MKNEIFKANPNLDLYYQTSDGEPFFTENAAHNHAKGLKNKSVTPVYRSDAEESDEEDSTDDNANEIFEKFKEIIVKGAEIVKPSLTVVNTDPFDPATFPNRVLTTEQTAPVVTTEPVTTEPVITEPVITEPVTTEPEKTEPVTTAPDAPVKTEVKEETKTVEAKTTKK